MLEIAEVTRQFIATIIEIIGRKTSDEYAAVTIRNLIKKIQPKYPFLREIVIKNTRSAEMESILIVNDALNQISPKEVGNALKDLMTIIVHSLGKNVGYFFIRETREKIGIEYDTILLKTMDVDLTFMQSTIMVEKKSENLLEIQKVDVMRKFLQNLMDAVERQTSKSFAMTCLRQHIGKLQQQYPFLDYLRINDIRQIGGAEEIVVQQELNTIDLGTLGKAITSILQETDKTLIDLGRNSVGSDLKSRLTIEYLAKLREMGVIITSYGIEYNIVFTEILRTLLDIIGKTRGENDAILTVNSCLRTMDIKYDFIKEIKIEQTISSGEFYRINIGETINTISETDARRVIQQLLENILETFEEKSTEEFIKQFKTLLDNKCLLKIEEMGVNFHMIELHTSIKR